MNYNSKYDSQKMKELRSQGKTYIEIAKTIGCSEWTVKHHLIPNRKKNQERYLQKKNIDEPLYFKRKRFMVKGSIMKPFSLKSLKEKIGTNPTCYLTGELIDLSKLDSYCLDHVIPVSRGGESSLKNLGLLKYEINQAKYNMTPEEFIDLCKRVVGP